jgi:hypothetical protein
MSINRFCAGWDTYPLNWAPEELVDQDSDIYDRGLAEESSRLFANDVDNVDILRLSQNRTA